MAEKQQNMEKVKSTSEVYVLFLIKEEKKIKLMEENSFLKVDRKARELAAAGFDLEIARSYTQFVEIRTPLKTFYDQTDYKKFLEKGL